MKRQICALLWCLVFLWSSASALSNMEATAVQSILDHYPSLLKISPWDQHDIDYQDYGGSWTKEMSEVCENGDGWDIYGIYCESGKVTGIRLYVAF